MSASKALKVLIVGKNPNVVFYAFRFQLARNIELFHVSDSKSNVFKIDTVTYGQKEFQLDNHFTSIENLREAMSSLSNGKSFIIDIIVLSASSLQELSSLPSKIKPLVDENTKIFIESTGFIQLEPFIKNSRELSSLNLNVFSMITHYDIRQIAPNNYKQFNNNSNSNVIYLGCKNTKKRTGSFLNSNKYSNEIANSLDLFAKMFSKLFPNDSINLCNHSYQDFLNEQWAIAIPKISLDPLLIIFEETSPSNLSKQILAKPLISGIITELITIAKNMNVKLSVDNEDKIISNWESNYKNDEIPSLLYHFIQRTSTPDIDLSLLQSILLADNYDIKTPYLEFLYTTFCQFDRLNSDNSKWFTRYENTEGLRRKLNAMTTTKNNFEESYNTLQLNLNEKEVTLSNLRDNDQLLRSKIASLEGELISARESLTLQERESANKISSLENQLQRLKLANNDSKKLSESFNDEQNDSVIIHSNNFNNMQREILANSTSLNVDRSSEALEPTKRELAIRERESELQKRFAQHQQKTHNSIPQSQTPQISFSNQYQHPSLQPSQVSFNQPPSTPVMQTNIPIKPKSSTLNRSHTMQGLAPINTKFQAPRLQQTSNISLNKVSNRSTPQPQSINNFHEHNSSSVSNLNVPFDGMDSRYNKIPHSSHFIKPTNRKNKRNDSLRLGHASSIGFADFTNQRVTPSTGLSYQIPRSASTNNFRSGRTSAYEMPNPVKTKPFKMNTINNSMNDFSSLQQRQISTSTMIENNVTKKPLSEPKPVIQFGSASNNSNSNNSSSNSTNTRESNSLSPLKMDPPTEPTSTSNSLEESIVEVETPKKKKKFGLFGRKKGKK
ncbi:hypothetical protein KAFR_0E02880 [Kazachstania africana CBS 2517]|uniref:Ketopantoate reductase C-terminal domain-containing protein n=1 Tax=Kazachstania africana (strain ATCC 22294 / BCRC 22015 / CBS 2517 / CECT 1963 / NBRC 1671 / NRRL Y-8276) TaxID=1071382 RepID=H2AVP0_KAZAF|nr:hypothetical protein KAFR_0E02880 [Kazachstania africana CBS 2517]CCF58440.1 hypothetical protein KAFR_0E02880 [Kazachstania africana CBS 2517]